MARLFGAKTPGSKTPKSSIVSRVVQRNRQENKSSSSSIPTANESAIEEKAKRDQELKDLIQGFGSDSEGETEKDKAKKGDPNTEKLIEDVFGPSDSDREEEFVYIPTSGNLETTRKSVNVTEKPKVASRLLTREQLNAASEQNSVRLKKRKNKKRRDLLLRMAELEAENIRLKTAQEVQDAREKEIAADADRKAKRKVLSMKSTSGNADKRAKPQPENYLNFTSVAGNDLAKLIEDDEILPGKKIYYQQKEKDDAEEMLNGIPFDNHPMSFMDFTTDTLTDYAKSEDMLEKLDSFFCPHGLKNFKDESGDLIAGITSNMLVNFAALEMKDEKLFGTRLGPLKSLQFKNEANQKARGVDVWMADSSKNAEHSAINNIVDLRVFESCINRWIKDGIVDLIEANMQLVEYPKVCQEFGNTMLQNLLMCVIKVVETAWCFEKQVQNNNTALGLPYVIMRGFTRRFLDVGAVKGPTSEDRHPRMDTRGHLQRVFQCTIPDCDYFFPLRRDQRRMLAQTVYGVCINYHTPVRHERTQVYRYLCYSNDDPYNTNPICFAGLVLNLKPQQNQEFFEGGKRNKFYRLFSAQLTHSLLRKAWPLVNKN